ncbi:hypothetical protein [Chitinophaga sp. YIM B06452]|uniref:hypothetical protein n=1 Tax=Chitinophaga sp. YIM B06452 TaxID=3082158 RepID=UPI0031FF1C38
MTKQPVYLHNSSHKDFIREKWIEFAQEMLTAGGNLSLITFPAEEMQDLHLFATKGLIEWEQTETGGYKIKKGKVTCFEKSDKIWMKLSKKLINATVEKEEIGSYFQSKYKAIMSKQTKIFPADVINLDYDGNISKNKVSIEDTIGLIFKYQALHEKNFSLFLTWPQTENEDEQSYKDMLKQTIEDNLDDPNAVQFKEKFETFFDSLNDLNYEQLSIIGLAKVIIKKASEHKFEIFKNEFYLYGEQNRRKMFSILLNFEFSKNARPHKIYSKDVVKSLTTLTDLNEKSN